jgi:hypothetical protein
MKRPTGTQLEFALAMGLILFGIVAGLLALSS